MWLFEKPKGTLHYEKQQSKHRKREKQRALEEREHNRVDASTKHVTLPHRSTLKPGRSTEPARKKPNEFVRELAEEKRLSIRELDTVLKRAMTGRIPYEEKYKHMEMLDVNEMEYESLVREYGTSQLKNFIGFPKIKTRWIVFGGFFFLFFMPFLLVPAAFAAIIYYVRKARQEIIDTHHSAEGVVVDLEGGHGTSDTYRPVIEFRAKDGEEIRFTTSWGSRPPSHKVGERVTVYYNPNDYHDARILYNWRSFGGVVVVLVSLGIVGAIVAAAMF